MELGVLLRAGRALSVGVGVFSQHTFRLICSSRDHPSASRLFDDDDAYIYCVVGSRELLALSTLFYVHNRCGYLLFRFFTGLWHYWFIPNPR